MAWMEYMAVRNSTVYENKGLAKSLLSLIAMLIERAEEERQPTENEGWCYASERYLAESLGMSEGAASRWIKAFKQDGWLVIECRPNQRGGQRNRYRLAENAMGRLEKLKRERGAERPKNLNKVRTDSIQRLRKAVLATREALVDDALRGENTMPTRSTEAPLLGASKHPRSEPGSIATPSVQRSGGRGFSEKSDENVAEQTITDSASQRKKKTNPKADAFGRQGTGVPLQPRANRNTPGETPVPPKAAHRHTWIEGKCFGCGQECEHLQVNREGFCRVCESDTWGSCSACRRRSDEIWGDGVCSICHYKSSLAKEAAVQWSHKQA